MKFQITVHLQKAFLRETVEFKIFCRQVFILDPSNLSFLILSLLKPPSQWKLLCEPLCLI